MGLGVGLGELGIPVKVGRTVMNTVFVTVTGGGTEELELEGEGVGETRPGVDEGGMLAGEVQGRAEEGISEGEMVGDTVEEGTSEGETVGGTMEEEGIKEDEVGKTGTPVFPGATLRLGMVVWLGLGCGMES